MGNNGQQNKRWMNERRLMLFVCSKNKHEHNISEIGLIVSSRHNVSGCMQTTPAKHGQQHNGWHELVYLSENMQKKQQIFDIIPSCSILWTSRSSSSYSTYFGQHNHSMSFGVWRIVHPPTLQKKQKKRLNVILIWRIVHPPTLQKKQKKRLIVVPILFEFRNFEIIEFRNLEIIEFQNLEYK